MRLTKSEYYADFVAYPALLVTAAVASAWRDTGYELSSWLIAAVIGAMCWTLLEYISTASCCIGLRGSPTCTMLTTRRR